MGDRMIGYIASENPDLAPGDNIFPQSDSYDPLCIADSHELAVACWRYTLTEHTYYRVEARHVYEGEPVPFGDVPGLFHCHAATILGKVHDGTGGMTGGVVGGPRWSNEELWPRIKMTRWPDGSALYDDQGYVINWPNATRPDEQMTVAVMRERRYLLPTYITVQLESVRPGRFGTGWPPWGPPHS
ncbi:hypothetical protein BST37_02420 [Mycobacterium noviomagense]|nr:hypothetical protein BST37_02420 [Mycobacterium noviomagense]